MTEIFDDWPDRYDQWFQTPLGRLIKGYESELILSLLTPEPGEKILDVGCGTGVFTEDILKSDARVTGVELSLTMLQRAIARCGGQPFQPLIGNMLNLPFADHSFQKAVSITAIEFIQDAGAAIKELFRVTRPGGLIVVATLNSLSPWASQREEAAQKGHSLFRHAVFRSPDEILKLSTVKGLVQTAIHFQKDDDPVMAREIEMQGREKTPYTGAFLAARWVKPE